MNLPFADESFDIVINEAMLTMLPIEAKKKAVSEYFRVLKKGGILLTHDVGFENPNLEKILEELKNVINVAVTPLHFDDWESLFRETGFSRIEKNTGDMSLMNPIGMIRDEGFFGALKIIRNGMKKKIVKCSKVCGNFSIIQVVISNILRSLLENNFLKNIYVTIRFFGLGFLFCRTPSLSSYNYLLESRTNIAKNSNKKNNFFNYFFRSVAPICIFSVVSNVLSSQYLWNGHSRELC